MPQYDNTNRGSIWKNEKRETERHPHFTGVANVNGKDMYVSAWKRDKGAKPTAPALTLSFKPKGGVVASTTEPFNDPLGTTEPFKPAVEDDDLPW